MNGMHRISGAGTMPANCGMPDMHQNTSAKKADSSADKLQHTQGVKLPGDSKENKIDVKI